MFLLRMRRYVIILLCCTATCAALRAEQVTFPTSTLDIKTQQATIHFDVEVATSDAQHEYGLMFRKSLADKHGMIFDFGKPQRVAFWMKNTVISLDMIFIDNGGVITQVVEDAPPESTDTIPSVTPVRAVLEVPAGTAERYHIAKGDKVLYSVFP